MKISLSKTISALTCFTAIFLLALSAHAANNIKWLNYYHNPLGPSQGKGITIDNDSGSIFVGGITPVGNSTNTNIVIIKYTNNGRAIKTNYPFSASPQRFLEDMTHNSGGGVIYICGSVKTNGRKVCFTAALNADDCSIGWETRYDNGKPSSGNSLYFYTLSSLCMAGTMNNGTNDGMLFREYNPGTGAQLGGTTKNQKGRDISGEAVYYNGSYYFVAGNWFNNTNHNIILYYSTGSSLNTSKMFDSGGADYVGSMYKGSSSECIIGCTISGWAGIVGFNTSPGNFTTNYYGTGSVNDISMKNSDNQVFTCGTKGINLLEISTGSRGTYTNLFKLSGGEVPTYLVFNTNTKSPDYRFIAGNSGNDIFAMAFPPRKPKLFSGVETSQGTITWSWTNTAFDDLGCKLMDQNDTFLTKVQTNFSGSYTESNLMPNRRYVRHVAVTNKFANIDSNSNAVWLKPSYPSRPVTSYTSVMKVGLSWKTNSGGASSFVIQNAFSSNGPWSTLVSNFPGTKYTNIDLLPSTFYYYRVACIGSTGLVSAWSTNSRGAVTRTSGLQGMSGFQTSYTSITRVGLKWTQNAPWDYSQYILQQGSSSNGPWTTFITNYAGTKGTNQGLLPGSIHYYRISGQLSAGFPAGWYYLHPALSMNKIGVTTDPSGISTSFVSSYTSVTRLGLKWQTNQDDISKFLVHKGFSGSGPWVMIASNISALNFTNSSLAPQSNYYFRIAGLCAAGQTPYYSIGPVSTRVSGIASSFVSSYTSVTRIGMKWQTNHEDVNKFLVQKSATGSPPWTTIATDISFLKMTNSSLAPQTPCYYRLAGYSPGGKTPLYSIGPVTTKPSGIASTFVSSYTSITRIGMAWKTNKDDVSSFVLHDGPTAGGPWTRITTNNPQLTFTNSSLVPQTAHYFRLTGYAGGGATPPYVIGPVSTKISGIASTFVSTFTSVSRIGLSWKTNKEDVNSFVLHEGPSGTGPWTRITTNNPLLNFTNSPLSPLSQHYFRLTGYNTGGNTPPYVIGPITTKISGLASSLVSTYTSISRVGLAWSTNKEDCKTFVVQNGLTAGGPWKTSASNITVLAFTNPHLIPATNNYFRISGFTGPGKQSAWYVNGPVKTFQTGLALSLTSTFTMVNKVGLEWQTNKEDCSLFVVQSAPTNAGPFSTFYSNSYSLEATNSGLPAGRNVWFRIRGYTGPSSPSSWFYAGPVKTFNSTLTAIPGRVEPPTRTITTGPISGIPVFGFSFVAGQYEGVRVTTLTLQAAALSGNDNVDIADIKLYRDLNHNSTNNTEPLVVTGINKFISDNGKCVLSLVTANTVGPGTTNSYCVTYDMSGIGGQGMKYSLGLRGVDCFGALSGSRYAPSVISPITGCTLKTIVSGNVAPIINNVSISPGNGKITVTYELIDGNDDTCNINVKARTKSGTSTATVTSNTLVTPGLGRVIIWDYPKDIKGNDNVVLILTPNDGTVDGASVETSAITIDNAVIAEGAIEVEDTINNLRDKASTSIYVNPSGSESLTVRIFNIQGLQVKSLVRNQILPKGKNILGWDFRDDKGGAVPSGIYWIIMESGGTKTVRKIVVVR